MPDGTLRFLLGDVTGHGAGSAMVTAIVAGCVRSLLLKQDRSTPNLLARLHGVVRSICHGEFMMTLTVLELDGEGRAHWWSCAAPPFLKLTARGEVQAYSGVGVPVGADGFAYSEGELTLAPGELVLLTSDGLLDLQTRAGHAFGLRRVARVLETCVGKPPEEVRALLLDTLDLHGCDKREDDLSFVIAGRRA